MIEICGRIGTVLAMVAVRAFSQENVTASDYKEVIVEQSEELSYNFEVGQFRYITGAVLTLIGEDAKDNLPVRAGRVEFSYPDAESNVFSRIVMTGGVEIDHPQGKVKSSRAEFDFDNGVVEFTGSPVMYNERAPEGFFGSTITLDLNTQTLNVKDGKAPRVILTLQGDLADQYLLKDTDISDWPAFIDELKRQHAAKEASPGKHIISLLDSQVQTAVTTNKTETIVAQKGQIVKLLNGVVKNEKFYNAAAWSGISLEPAAAEAFAKGAGKLSKQELVWANRSAFHSAYPNLVAAPPALSE